MKHYHKNPRQISDRQLDQLRSTLAELGDLAGIVHNLPTDEIIGGNQRGRVFDINQCETVLLEQYEEPDAQGTVAHGFVIWQGAKYAYRQVVWTPEQCEKANIVANKAGGTWDFDVLANEFDLGDLLDWGFEPVELGLAGMDDPIPISDDVMPLDDFAAVSEGDGFVPFKFGDYSGRVGRIVYDSFVEAYRAQQEETGDLMMDDVLRSWLNV